MIQTFNIPDIFKTDDVIYHYCSLSTAIQYILHEKRILLSPRKKSIDPIENIQIDRHINGSGYSNDRKIATEEEGKKVVNFVTNIFKNAKQACFCMNDSEFDNRIKQNNENVLLFSEYYGFLKPRMWDQYGDKYQGVCIVFSKSKLEQNNNKQGKCIEYVDYSKINLQYKTPRLDDLYDKGFETYKLEYFKQIEQNFYRKHLDYAKENEFRFVSYSDAKADYLDISESLLGIVASKLNLNDFSLKMLNKYAEEFNVDLLFISWDVDGVRIKTKKEIDESKKQNEKIRLYIENNTNQKTHKRNI